MRNVIPLRFVATALLVFLISMLIVTPAWAEEGTPPPDPTPAAETGTAATEGGGAPETAPAEGSSPEDPPAVDPAPAEAPADPPALDEVLADLPEGAAVAVVVEDGEAAGMAVVDPAGQVVGDPIWCPAGVGTPVSGGSGCTGSYGSLQALLDFLTINQPAADGVIWIEKTYDSSVNDPAEANFVLNGSLLGTMANYRLTIRGGWNGLGTGTVDVTDPSEINASLEISNWNKDVTLSDLLITGAPAPNSLWVTTSGKITLTRVTVEANAGLGAYLNNVNGTADVVLSQSDFSGNVDAGLMVSSRGAILATDVVASSNGSWGALLGNTSASSAKPVTVTRGTFEDNGSQGLSVQSRGTINVKDLVAVGNGSAGAILGNSLGTTAGINLTGTNAFAENGSSGLDVFSNGPIKANNVIAAFNAGYGVYFDNSFATTAQPVILTGASEFKFNEIGLGVWSKGSITASNLTATFNSVGSGVYFNNAYSGFSSPVTLTGTNLFHDNTGRGIMVVSHGVITLSNVTADWNGQGGASVLNLAATSAKAVTLSGKNQFNGNAYVGLTVLSRGPVTVSNVTANGNTWGAGVQVNNTFGGSGSPQNVVFSIRAEASNNHADGLFVETFGSVTIANLTADGNGWSGFGYGAYIENSLGTAVRPVTLTGTNKARGNSVSGLGIWSLGAITLNAVTASGNVNMGAFVVNDIPGAVGGVTIKGTNEFSGNGSSGLVVYSRGAITVADVEADFNFGHGAYLNNTSAGAANVSLGTSRANWCNSFFSNTAYGLFVASNGVVTLSNVCTSGNGFRGIEVNNSTAGSAKAVALKGVTTVTNETGIGLFVQSRGPITASNLSVTINGGTGAFLSNQASGSGSPQNVTLTGVNEFRNNTWTGLEVFSYGTISLSNTTASGNGSSGAVLDNYIGAATIARGVTLSGTNQFYGNGTDGLWVTSLGSISASNLRADFNGNHGVVLTNDFGSTTAGVTISGTNGFYGNGFHGLQVGSYGPITASNLDALGNLGWGAYLVNSASASPQNVTVTGTNTFSGNDGHGLAVYSIGAISVNNVTASGNGGGGFGSGVVLQNSAAPSPKPVTVGGTNTFDLNSAWGLRVISSGPIKTNNLTARWNSFDGVDLHNRAPGAGASGVTLTGTNRFEGNDWIGLRVESHGSITGNSLTAIANAFDGANLSTFGLSAPQKITLTGSNTFTDNGDFVANTGIGLVAFADGQITVTNLTASWNASDGAYLDNVFYGWTGTPGIELKGTASFVGNSYTGLAFNAIGPVIVPKITADANGLSGVYGTSLGNISLSCASLMGNGGYGWALSAGGTITLKGVFSFGNLSGGGLNFGGGPVVVIPTC